MPTKQAWREQRALERKLPHPERPRHPARRHSEGPVRVFHDGPKGLLESEAEKVGGEAIGGPHLRLQHGAPACQPVADAGCPRR